MKNTTFRVFIKNICAYTIVLAICLLFIGFVHLEAKDKLDVSMFPFANEYRKDRKLLRNFSVPIMNTDSLKLIKYEKIYSTLKKAGVDIVSLNATNITSNVESFQSRFIILPTITIATNITIEIDEKLAAQTNKNVLATNTNTTNMIIDSLDIADGSAALDLDAEDSVLGIESLEKAIEQSEIGDSIDKVLDVASVLENSHDAASGNSGDDNNDSSENSDENAALELGVVEDVENLEHIENVENTVASRYGIINLQLLDYVNKLPTTNFITNIVNINDKVFVSKLNNITATNALTFVTNTEKTYHFDLIDTETTNVLYTKAINNTNQVGTVSLETINTLEFYLAKGLFSELARATSRSQNISYADFWVERKPRVVVDINASTNITADEPKSSWTDGRTPIFSISSGSGSSSATNTNYVVNDNQSVSEKSDDDGFERVVITDNEPIALFDVGDSIRFDFDIYQSGYVNIVYLPPPSTNISPPTTNMSLLYPNNYNMGYATNNNTLLPVGLYQVPAIDNNIELILREAGLSKVYFIYSDSKDVLYDLTKFQNAGFLLIRDTLDFVWHLEDFYNKNTKNNGFIIHEITIETRDIETPKAINTTNEPTVDAK